MNGKALQTVSAVMEMCTRPLAAAGVLLLACAGAACDVKVSDKGVSLDLADGRASDEWTRTYSLPRNGRLEIVNIDGAIEAFPSSSGDVEVRVTREVRSRSDEAARDLLAKVTLREEVAADRVLVASPDVRQLGGFLQGVRIAYRVHVPPGLSVSLTTQNGAVQIENVEGRFTLASTNGTITGRGVSGTVDASTVNGGINVQLVAVTGDVRFVTVNGGIRLDLPPDVDATLDASAVNGGVVVHERVPLAATERSRLRVSGRINDGGSRVQVQTTNGGIQIRTAGPGEPAADVERPRPPRPPR